MKKIYLFAAAAALLTACSSEELANQEVVQQNAETPVAFSIYTPRSVTRAGVPEMITDANIKDADTPQGKAGFGVFAYYTDGQDYQSANTFPNFMYNQQVLYKDGKWGYEPVKYWPNEYGNAATSDDIDRVTFFAYAPWVKVEPSTGIAQIEKDGKFINVADDEKNITAVTRNNGVGDPIIKYVVDTDPDTSVDLLWGVYGGENDYVTTWGSATATVKPGAPFIDLLKPNDPTGTDATVKDGKIVFNLRHALAKLNVTIDFKDDVATPGTYGTAESNTLNPAETKIFIREIKIGGFTMKGALNLNNTKSPKVYDTAKGWGSVPADDADKAKQYVPNWKAYDGVNDLEEYEAVVFKDGRRDAKEGTIDGAISEKTFGLNPKLIQSEPYKTNTEFTQFTNAAWANGEGLTGVTATVENLFGDGNDAASDPIFVIPVDQPIDIEIVYDVETINPKLAGFLSDGLVHGSSIQNTIRKTSKEIFSSADAVKMRAGVFYILNIHLGMTSVKVDASVNPWGTDKVGNAELPANQPEP